MLLAMGLGLGLDLVYGWLVVSNSHVFILLSVVIVNLLSFPRGLSVASLPT